MLRQFFFLLNVFFWTILVGSIAILVGIIDFRGKFISWLARMYSTILLWASGVRYHVLGLEKLDNNSHYVFASNHQSAFDIPLILCGIESHIVFLAKKELKKVPILGWAMMAGRHVFIDRFNTKSAVRSLNKAKNSLRSNPRSLIIFPEGTRSKDGEVHQFKKGGLAIAMDIGMDVVPLAVCGTGTIVPKKSFILNRGEVELRIGEPICVDDWKGRPSNEFADHVRTEVMAMKKLSIS